MNTIERRQAAYRQFEAEQATAELSERAAEDAHVRRMQALAAEDPAEDLSIHKPRLGQSVTYESRPYGVVRRIEGNFCWTVQENVDQADSFFRWRVRAYDEFGVQKAGYMLNPLFDWPTKTQPEDAR